MRRISRTIGIPSEFNLYASSGLSKYRLFNISSDCFLCI